MNIIEILKKHLQQTPDKLALLHKGKQISYQELDTRSRAAAAFFSKHGVDREKKALLFIPLSIELYLLFLGLVRSGVTVILIDPSAGRAHISACVASVKPDAFIGVPRAHLLRLISAVQKIPQKFSTHCWIPWIPGSTLIRYTESDTASDLDYDCPSDHPALITFTSGSTGLPKGISRSHAFLINQHKAISRALISEDTDVELNTLPVFVLSNLASGITTVIPNTDVRKPATADAEQLVHQIRSCRVNRLMAAPAFFRNLVDYLATQSETLDEVRKIYTGGGPVFPNLLDQLSVFFPQAKITAVYGSTEAEPIAHLNMDEIDQVSLEAMQQGKGLLAGQAVREISLAIIPDKDGAPIGPFTQDIFRKLALPPMHAGEIVVSGDHVQKSYISGDDGKIKFKVDEVIWHRTGDAGYIDNENRLWLLGRCSAKIVKEEQIIYPFGIEAAAMSCAEVTKAALTSLQGTTILAIETTSKNKASLSAQIRAHLKDVDSVQVLEKIPVDKRHNSKVLYSELRQLLKKRH